MKKYVIATTLLLALPALAFAAGTPLVGLEGFITQAGILIRQATLVVAALALLAFFWGLAQFIFKAGKDPKAVADGKSLMIWGVVALFVMVSVWGLVGFLQKEFLPGSDFTAPPGLGGGSGSIRI